MKETHARLHTRGKKADEGSCMHAQCEDYNTNPEFEWDNKMRKNRKREHV